MVTFSLVPTDNKIPLFYAEVSGSKALPNAAVGLGPSLVIGQGLGTGFVANVPVRIFSQAQANSLFRPGSMLARQIAAYFANDPYGELWALPLADKGTAPTGCATKTINFVGTATAAGVVSLYFGGVKVPVTVTSGMTAEQIASAYQAALGTNEAAAYALGSPVPMTATASAAALTVTARNSGTVGNGLTIHLNYGGAAAGEALPAGITITEFASAKYVTLTSGATDPDLITGSASGIASALGTKKWSFINFPYTGTTPSTGPLALLKTVMADSSTGRWGPTQKYYGHAFAAIGDTDTNISGKTLLNDPHTSIFAIEGSPTWDVEIGAAYCARAAGSARVLASRPLNTLELVGVLPPHTEDVWDYSTRKTVMDLGFTVPMASDSEVRIARAVTTYVKNTFGASDPTFLDVTTLFNLDYQLTNLEAAITTAYPRHILVDDDTNVGPGVPAVTPSAIKNLLISIYRKWERMGLVENTELFIANLVVERDVNDPNRVNVYFSPDLANGLHTFALLNEFRLQYAEAA